MNSGICGNISYGYMLIESSYPMDKCYFYCCKRKMESVDYNKKNLNDSIEQALKLSMV
jgi:hypothetical protein